MKEFYRYGYTTYYGGRVVVDVQVYYGEKETPKGWWIITSWNPGAWCKRRWVSNTSRKRFAYPTKEEALESLICRKERQLEILKSRTVEAQRVKAIAEKMKKDKDYKRKKEGEKRKKSK